VKIAQVQQAAGLIRSGTKAMERALFGTLRLVPLKVIVPARKK
jgi:hypothetical protein